MKYIIEFTGGAFSDIGYGVDPKVKIAAMSIDQVRIRLNNVCSLQAKLDAEKLALNARLVSLLHDPVMPACVVPEIELMKHGGLTSREAHDVTARGRVTGIAPAIGEVLASGATTAAHVDALGRGLRIAGDQCDAFLAFLPELVEASTIMSASKFDQLVKETAKSVVTDDGLSVLERQKRETFFSMRQEHDGCLSVRGKFDPLSASILSSKLGRLVESMFHSGDKETPVEVAPWVQPNDHRQALALIALVGGATESLTSEVPTRAEIIVHVDLETLRHGIHGHSTCRTGLGADLPVETVRRLACEADIIPVVLDGKSVPIDVGRAKRLATATQRRALEAVYSRCAIPDCETRFDHCQIHHIEYWENNGATDLDNMIPLCSRHHHAAHEGGWKLVLDESTRLLHIGRD